MAKRIPELRADNRILLAELEAEIGPHRIIAQLRENNEATRRIYTKKPARRVNGFLPPEKVLRIRELIAEKPDRSYRNLAAVFDTSVRECSYVWSGNHGEPVYDEVGNRIFRSRAQRAQSQHV